jgi:hypothetical protein
MAVVSMIERLPLELKQDLLAALADLASLRSAALSCPSMYHAFVNAEKLITNQVVNNQIDAAVLPEAVGALKSSRPQPWTRQGVGDFIHHHLQARTYLPHSLTLSEAWALGRLHSGVERFAAEFIAEMLNPSSVFAHIDAPPGWAVSKNETNRVQRAFYRFEVYCNLFRGFQEFQPGETEKLFLFNFSYWENEQLACIHDYLFRAVCPGMDVSVSC